MIKKRTRYKRVLFSYVIGNSAGFPMTQNPPGDATDAHGKYASCCLRASARKEPQTALCSDYMEV